MTGPHIGTKKNKVTNYGVPEDVFEVLEVQKHQRPTPAEL